MRKSIICIIALIAGALGLQAQPRGNAVGKFNVSLQGGAALSISENAFSYPKSGNAFKLIDPVGGIAFGYDFSEKFGARLSFSYGKNSGGFNVIETKKDGFFPFEFQSFNIFADAMLNMGTTGNFTPIMYAGVGMGHSMKFTDPDFEHWQKAKLTDPNTALGARLGFIARFRLTESFGVFGDVCGEAYTDKYSGLKPDKADQPKGGYSGLPVDLRGLLTFGCIYYF